MTSAQTDETTRRKPLRLWPGVLVVVLQWVAKLVLPIFGAMGAAIGAMGALVCGFAVVVWWAFFSRAPRSERWGAASLMIVALIAASRLSHESIRAAGMGMTFFIYTFPILCLAFVVWALAGRRLSDRPRRVAMVAVILLACGASLPFRFDGITGDGATDFEWRWTETHEERLLAQAGDEPTARPQATADAETEADWPGFRGAGRDGVVRGVRIETDWSASPPVELWRRPIGPGISSFAVRGERLYTQEQRGDDEVVACYDAMTGEPVWRHRDATRFWDAHAGAGPRATPTLVGGRLYTFGATGILNALDAANGSVVWSRDVAADNDARPPDWGFTSSPLVVDGIVVVNAGALIAYDIDSGEQRWVGPVGGSYSSPHLVTIDGVAQILMLAGGGANSVAPADGRLLWKHSWRGSIVQPALTADGNLLVSAGGFTGGAGMRRIAVAHGPEGWTTEERWTSDGLKPYFNDFVVHEGHAFGFDGSILACIDLADGTRRWKGGRYGHGQLVLLADQGLLLVLSEQGELALVAAAPDKFTELARFPAIEGKSWNHPVLVGDLLLVRNGREMAAFRLSLAGD